MKDADSFINAYYDFKKSIDFTKKGVLPQLDNLVGFMLIGIPPVPADSDSSQHAPITAIDQRVIILKVVFVEVNKDQPDDFIDQGLMTYDRAGKVAKVLLRENTLSPDSELE